MSVEARVRATGLLDAPVLVLLSGGRDSVCLLDLAARIAPEVRALHVDYGLRAGSGADAEHCAAVCGRLGVELAVHRPPPRAGGNLQAWARDVRYAEAARLASGAAIATGHTASDQAETVLYRLAASPGRRALLGMRERAGGVVRPLLQITRAETSAYCAEHGLAWRDDPTNDSPDYARNRARAALAALHPAAEANVLRTLATAARRGGGARLARGRGPHRRAGRAAGDAARARATVPAPPRRRSAGGAAGRRAARASAPAAAALRWTSAAACGPWPSTGGCASSTASRHLRPGRPS